MSAYGTVGPDKDMAGYDFAAGWARSGIQDMLSVPGHAAAGVPARHHRPRLVDADLRRHRARRSITGSSTGEGQKVEFNLYHTGVWMVGADIMDALFGLPLRRVDPTKSDNPFYDVYQCKDGRWLQLTAADRYAKAHDPAGQRRSGQPSAAPSTGRTWPTTRASPPPTCDSSTATCWRPILNEVVPRHAPTRSGRSACAPRTSCTARSSRRPT